MTPSLQTTPTVVVPFKANWFGMFDISLFSRYRFLDADNQNSSGIRKTVFFHDSLISVTVCFVSLLWLSICLFFLFFDVFRHVYLFIVVFSCFSYRLVK
jgi:hypothetical protein